MQDSTNQTNTSAVAEYILSLVEQDISILKTQRLDLIERYRAGGNDMSERDINHGQLLALSKIKGRLEAMLEIQSWNPELDRALDALLQEGK